MIRLGGRLAVSGGRESIVRLTLTAVGVALATTLLLLAGAADPAIRAQQRHQAWQLTGEDAADLEGSGDALLWQLTEDVVAGRELLVLRVAAGGPSAPVPLGLDHIPRPGEVAASAPLAELLRELPADRLADRFPGPPTATVDDAFLAGPDHLVAVVGVDPAELEGRALEVHHVRTAPASLQPGDFLRLVLGIGAVGLLLPIVVFVATSTRLGAARREQRFAALRLAGATPRQTSIVAAVEAGAAAVAGVALGAAGYVVARPHLAGVEIDGHPSFVDDVRVAPWLFALIVLAVPAVALITAIASLRRLQVSPLGVARRAVRPRPTVRRLGPLGVGTVGLVLSVGAAAGSRGGAPFVLVVLSFALIVGGIVAAGPWFTVFIGRAIGRFGRRASALLAGRRLEDDPAAAFRAVSGVVLAVFVASVFSGVTPGVLAENRAVGSGLDEGTNLMATLPDRTTSAQVAAALTAAQEAGGGAGVVLHADPDPDRPLADPAEGRGRTLILTCDSLAPLRDAPCPAGTAAWVDVSAEDLRLEPAPYEPSTVDRMPPAAVVVHTDGTAAATDRIRTAIQRHVPGAETRLGTERNQEGSRRLRQLERLTFVAIAVTLLIAGCGLAVAVAGGIIERQRPFTLLRLSGVHLRELQRVALMEAAVPLVLIATASAALGLLTSAIILEAAAAGIEWVPPSVGYWSGLIGGLAVALAITAVTLPLLGRTTSPSEVRFE